MLHHSRQWSSSLIHNEVRGDFDITVVRADDNDKDHGGVDVDDTVDDVDDNDEDHGGDNSDDVDDVDEDHGGVALW